MESSVAYFLAREGDPGCTVFNPFNKTYARLSQPQMELWTKMIKKEGAERKHNLEGLGWIFGQPKLIGSETISGVHTTVYVTEHKFMLGSKYKSRIFKTWYCSEKVLSELPLGASVLVARMTKTTKIERHVPVRETLEEKICNANGEVDPKYPVKTVALLDLISLKREPYDPKKMELPSDFKELKDPMAVLDIAGTDGRRRY